MIEIEYIGDIFELAYCALKWLFWGNLRHFAATLEMVWWKLISFSWTTLSVAYEYGTTFDVDHISAAQKFTKINIKMTYTYNAASHYFAPRDTTCPPKAFQGPQSPHKKLQFLFTICKQGNVSHKGDFIKDEGRFIFNF